MLGIEIVPILMEGIKAIRNLQIGKIEERALIEEVKEELINNIKIIKDDYITNQVAIFKIITVMKINKLENAEKARKRKKLDFNKIKKGRIDKSCFISDYQYYKYKDYDTSKILLKLREKFNDLKKVKQLYYSNNKWSNKINPKSRMNTIVNLFALLSKHLSMK